MRTVDDAIADAKVRFAGRTQHKGRELPDDELMVAEIERLRATLDAAAGWRPISELPARLETVTWVGQWGPSGVWERTVIPCRGMILSIGELSADGWTHFWAEPPPPSREKSNG